MKSSELHNNLESKEIRDFLSISFVKIFDEEYKNQIKYPPYPGTEKALEWNLERMDLEIEARKKDRDFLLQKIVLVKLVKMNGWEEHDLSDEVQNDSIYKLCPCFIGSEDECKEILKQIKKKK